MALNLILNAVQGGFFSKLANLLGDENILPFGCAKVVFLKGSCIFGFFGLFWPLRCPKQHQNGVFCPFGGNLAHFFLGWARGLFCHFKIVFGGHIVAKKSWFSEKQRAQGSKKLKKTAKNAVWGGSV